MEQFARMLELTPLIILKICLMNTSLHECYLIYLLSYSSKRGKGGTKRLGLRKGASQKTYLQLHSQLLPKLHWKQKQKNKQTKNIAEHSTKIQKTSTHIHTPKTSYIAPNKQHLTAQRKAFPSVIDNKLNSIWKVYFHKKSIRMS